MKSRKKFTALKILGAMTVMAMTMGYSGMASATMSYECWTNPGGHPDKMIHVSANSVSEAISLAIEKFRSIGDSPVNVTCK